MVRFALPRVLLRVCVWSALSVTLAHAQTPPPRPVQTALPPNGVVPTENPLAHAPDVTGLPPNEAIVVRVFHFLGHLFGGPSTQQTMPSPWHDTCGVRPCPYDLRN